MQDWPLSRLVTRSAHAERRRENRAARHRMFANWDAFAVDTRGEWFPNRELIPQDVYGARYTTNFQAGA